MAHQFSPQLASEYGIEEAIFIHNFCYWIKKNAANEHNFFDGRYWTYNTIKAFQELFPYMNETKIHRVLKHLVDVGILIKGKYNSDKFDHTCWYAFTEDAYEVLKKAGYDNIEFVKMKNGSNQKEITIPHSKHSDSKTDIKCDKKKKKENIKKKKESEPPTEAEHNMFEKFRTMYSGTKRGHDTEFDYFIAQNPDWRDILPQLCYAVEKENRLRAHAQATRNFFPRPKNLQTYLSGKNRAWEAYTDDYKEYDPNEYHPQCDGISLFWDKKTQCYITPFDVDNVTDGYKADTRPNGAKVIWGGRRYIWSSEQKQWVRQ